jgi:hypothetical protein
MAMKVMKDRYILIALYGSRLFCFVFFPFFLCDQIYLLLLCKNTYELLVYLLFQIVLQFEIVIIFSAGSLVVDF